MITNDYRWAVEEAARLGAKIEWSRSGGPWYEKDSDMLPFSWDLNDYRVAYKEPKEVHEWDVIAASSNLLVVMKGPVFIIGDILRVNKVGGI